MTTKDAQSDVMSWTNQELEILVKAGFVPEYLLHPSMYIELCEFLKSNKEILNTHCGRYPENIHDQTIGKKQNWLDSTRYLIKI